MLQLVGILKAFTSRILKLLACSPMAMHHLVYGLTLIRYGIIAAGPMALAGDKEAANICLQRVGLEEEQYRLGHTKVFFRAGVLGFMEEKRDERIQHVINLLQAQCRCYLIQKKHLLFKSQR